MITAKNKNKDIFEGLEMKKTLIKKVCDNNGIALPSVLLAMIVLAVIIIAVTALATSNTRQLATQELNLKAHYLARSGIEIAYTALMVDYDGILFSAFEDNGAYANGEILGATLNNLPGGTVDLTIQRDPASSDYVTITAFAELDDGIGRSQVVVDINIDNQEDLIWRN